ncbi:hypothetical protein Pint_36588 [Pistacia integerrima]|uniref:Uncharacterized protein n=1 Tax=Pistacia integerrima TaxID=434235 RepID=A0ACC0Y2C5_9ROSI|nr:hypothetical protein Pint_36588 [Pistacia integerrima]
MARDSCLARVGAGVAVGGAVGGAVGAVYGTYEAIRYKPVSPPSVATKPVLIIAHHNCHHFTINITIAISINCHPFFATIDPQHMPRFELVECSLVNWDLTNQIVPGILKIRYIGQTTLGSAAIFGLFLGAGSLIHCGKSY